MIPWKVRFGLVVLCLVLVGVYGWITTEFILTP